MMDTKINKLDTIFLRSTVTNQINQTIFVTDETTLAPITLVNSPTTMVNHPTTMVSYPTTMLSYPTTMVNYPTTMVSYPTTMFELSDHYAELSDHYGELCEAKIVGEGEPATAVIKMSKQQLIKDYSIKTKP